MALAAQPRSFTPGERLPLGLRSRACGLVAFAVQVEHAVDQLLDRAAPVRDRGEVAQVLLARCEVLRKVGGTDTLVTSNHDLRVQRGDRVDAGDPRLTLCLVRFVHHHVNVVVDDVACDDSLGGWDVEGRRSLHVALPDVNHADDLAVDQDLVGLQHLGHHRRLRELPSRRQLRDNVSSELR